MTFEEWHANEWPDHERQAGKASAECAMLKWVVGGLAAINLTVFGMIIALFQNAN